MKQIIIIILLVLIYMLIKKNSINESFRQMKMNKTKFRNIFTLDIFKNKTIFLIANNPNLSNKTNQFLNNYDPSNSLVVRFNGYKPIIKNYGNGRTDIMIYRKYKKGFFGYDKHTYNKNIINAFTHAIPSRKHENININEFTKDLYIGNKKYLNLPSNYIMLTHTFDKLKYPKKCPYSWTTGFNFLIYLLHLKNININHIYLIGYTFHNKKDGGHCTKWESQYYEKNIKNMNNIKILL
jgi:hypothetical protein